MRDWEAFVREQLDLPGMKGHREERMISELADHLEDVFEEALLRGVTEVDAEALMLHELGDRKAAARELIRSEPAHIRASANRWAEKREERARRRGGPWSTVADMGQGLRLTLRTLRKAPLFTAATILVLALGIGASTAIFSVVDGVLLQALPYPNAERIVRVYSTDEDSDRENFSGADLLDLRGQSEAFSIVAGYNVLNMNLVEQDGPRRLRGVSVTSDFFNLFGVDAYLGRTLSSTLDLPGGPRVVVLEHGLWQSAFGGDPKIVGSSVELNDEIFEVVGVMPPGFDYPNVALWTSSQYVVPDPPFDFGEDPGGDRGSEYIDAVGLLAESASLDEAQSEMSLIANRL
ncbi:MAG: ABC transporter permease, partial [Gemmatimonadetes bacterium]|nr:ABC transporter permease [Gemmatimonadota bacterium]